MEVNASQQLPFSRLHSNFNLSRTSPNPLSQRFSQSEGDSIVVSNIKNLCLSLLQTHNAVDKESTVNPAPSRVTPKNSSSRFKKFKERIIEDSSVRFQEGADSYLNHTLSKSKQRSFYKNRIDDRSKEKTSKSKSIQKRVFQYILEQYKDKTITSPKHKSKHREDQERILQYFDLKKKFVAKIQKLPNCSKYLSSQDVDNLFKQCFSQSIPEIKWQLYVINHIESKRKKGAMIFV